MKIAQSQIIILKTKKEVLVEIAMTKVILDIKITLNDLFKRRKTAQKHAKAAFEIVKMLGSSQVLAINYTIEQWTGRKFFNFGSRKRQMDHYKQILSN